MDENKDKELSHACANCDCHLEYDIIICDECLEDAKYLRIKHGLEY